MSKAMLLLFLFVVPIGAQSYSLGTVNTLPSVSCSTGNLWPHGMMAQAAGAYECCVTAAAALGIQAEPDLGVGWNCPTDGTTDSAWYEATAPPGCSHGVNFNVLLYNNHPTGQANAGFTPVCIVPDPPAPPSVPPSAPPDEPLSSSVPSAPPPDEPLSSGGNDGLSGGAIGGIIAGGVFVVVVVGHFAVQKFYKKTGTDSGTGSSSAKV